MGSRRLRDLGAIAGIEIALLEHREDRRQRAAGQYPDMRVFGRLEDVSAWQPQALSISTPPDHHQVYRSFAIDHGLHHFCEADIWVEDAASLDAQAAAKGLVAAPSCSFYFLPVVQTLKRIIREELGGLHAFQMALNTYMPDWHRGEGAEYYARHRSTSAGREMVPFELLWLNDVFGTPSKVAGRVSRRGKLAGVEEDTWSLQMQLADGATGQLTVAMGSPATLRQGVAIGDAGQVIFDLMSGEIHRIFKGGHCDTIQCGRISEVLEATYQQEMRTFIRAIQGRERWPQSYVASATATATLAAAEASGQESGYVRIDIAAQPAHLPSV